MILVIGGYAQGKLEYVKSKYGVSDEDVYDFEKSDTLRGTDIDIIGAYDKNDFYDIDRLIDKSDRYIVFNNINCLIKKVIKDGNNIDDLIEKLIADYPNTIIITDEVGNGIVPVDKNERLLREKTGRIQCLLAEKANEVIRVICGIGQKIK
ncbi:MAG: bifunctional adenosylcobinamide kinase/adenosylcobinamide-phosphate guanylyltransferase [Lachnospiraceae bacterium]|nr:bifunctional adenosylcobinamide kinase/adenosylcobinamide-phosphate guanylyltransferase [Lachnospiraceae bacterium]